MTQSLIFEAACPAWLGDRFEPGPTTAWLYRRASARHAIETAYWEGPASPDGKTHFHDEAQMVFTISGRRQFIVRSSLYVVNAGQCLFIPAGQLHRSVPDDSGPTRCLNLYVPQSNVAALCNALQVGPMTAMEARDVSDVVRRSLIALSDMGNEFGDVSALAASFGYSREAFSRKFSRETGVGPAEFSLLVRLNRARALLRKGDSAAMTALECGFADQSHMGRQFLRVFGTSPVQYARA